MAGTVISAADAKSYLQEANRDYYGRKTWQSLYGSTSLSGQQSASALQKDYASDVAQAYASAQQSKQAVAASNIGQGYKTVAQDEIDKALAEAFETYQNNYATNYSKLASSNAEAISQINKLQTAEAENMSAYLDKPYEYLQTVWDKYKDTYTKDALAEYNKLDSTAQEQYLIEHPELKAAITNLFNNPNWSKYLTERVDEETGKTYYDLMTWDELSQGRGFYDTSGNLTMAGTDFFDQMINEPANLNLEGLPTFGSWLKEKDSNLYDWANSDDIYNYTLNAKKFSSMQQAVGMMSYDQQYTFVERYGGMSSDEVKGIFSTIETKANDIAKRVEDNNGSDENTKAIFNDYIDLARETENVIKQLGMNVDEIQKGFATAFKQAGLVEDGTESISFADMIRILEVKADKIKDTNQIDNGGAWGAGTFGLAGLLTGAFVAGPIGAVVGLTIGVFGGLIAGATAGASRQIVTEAYNKNLSNTVKAQMSTLITELTAIAEQQRKNAQGE